MITPYRPMILIGNKGLQVNGFPVTDIKTTGSIIEYYFHDLLLSRTGIYEP